MTTIPASDAFAAWQKDPAYRAAYEALAPQYELASALIAARTRAGLTQAQLAERICTSQSAIARLESGRARPSTRTLERIASATGSRLRVVLEGGCLASTKSLNKSQRAGVRLPDLAKYFVN